MYSTLYNPDWSELFKSRLQQIEKELRELNLSTREEYQAAVYSRLNRVFNMENTMTPLQPVVRQGPAVVGDVQGNLGVLNNDASAIAEQLVTTENTASRLLNLYAATQNSLRQQIRELVYQPTNQQFVEGFVSGKNLVGAANVVDFNAGIAALPLVKESEIAPISVRLGPETTDRDANDASALSALTDSQPETVMVWTGETLELIFEFKTVTILNRMRIELDDYNGLTLAAVTSSPDGTLREDILADVDPSFQVMDGSSGKFTGDYILDFIPKHVKQLRLVIKDRVGQRRIALRSVTFFQRQYQNKATIQTKEITQISGDCFLTTKQTHSEELTALTHLISEDGVHYRVIYPDESITLPERFFYRCMMERIDQNFAKESNPVEVSGSDPSAIDTATRVKSISTVDLGAGVVERTIDFDSVVGGILLRETPLPKTMIVTSGMISVMPENGPVVLGDSPQGPNIVTLINNKLSFLYEVTGVTVRYQTSALGNAGLVARKNFYSPYLYEVRFQKN